MSYFLFLCIIHNNQLFNPSLPKLFAKKNVANAF